MPRHREPLSGGLNTGRDPALLQPGELSDCQNALYLPGSQALQRSRGRVAFGTVTATAFDISGLRDLTFDNSDHYLIAMSSGTTASYSTATVEGAGTFGILTTSLTASSSLEAVQYTNRWYLFNGVAVSASALNSNGVIYLSATAANSAPIIRQHGMLPVSAVVSPSATAASSFAASASGFYEYWTTEVAKYTQDGTQQELEGTFIGTPLTVYVSATSVAPVVSMPSILNPITTHWRIYRSPKKSFATDRAFPSGFMVGEQSTGLAQYVDTSSATVGNQVLGGGVNGSAPYATFTNAARLTAADGSYASAAVGVVSTGWGAGVQVQYQGVSAFSFGGFQGPILGIEVEFKCYVSSGTPGAIGFPVSVILGKRQADGHFVPGLGGSRTTLVTAASVGGAQTITLGGSADRWCPPDQTGFVDTDFDGNFMAVMQYTQPNTTLGVDYLKTRVYYGAGQSEAAIKPFPTVVYTFGDIIAQVGKNGAPPASRTGDMYQDSLVVNDEASPKLIRYSAPGLPEYFPGTYYVDFETSDNDVVTCIKVVNNRLMVGLRQSIWRLNYLPSERDASFDRGKSKEVISSQYGVVNAMCGCIYSQDGKPEQFAWVSDKGIHASDGYSLETLTDNLDWRSLYLAASSTAIALINDPERKSLLFYYKNAALPDDQCMCLPFCYAPDHDEHGLKVGGTVHLTNFVASATATVKSVWPVRRANGDTSVYLGYGGVSATAGAGKVFIESGTNIPAQEARMKWTSRRMYMAGEGGEWRLNELYHYVGSYSGTPIVTTTPLTVKTNDPNGEVTQEAKTRTLAGEKLHKHNFRQIVEGVRLQTVVSGQVDYKQEFMVIDGLGFGDEDSGKA